MRVLAVHQEQGSELVTLEGPVHEGAHDLLEWHPWRGDPVPDLGAADAIVAMGGIVHPDADVDHPWLVTERGALAQAIADGTPYLGVCLGAQLACRALGAQVARLPEAEVGWFAIEALPAAADDPLLAAFPARFPAFQWHEYGFELPAGAELLARSVRAPHQAARIGERAWALQFHLEVDLATVGRWCVEGAAELEQHGIDPAAVLAESEREMPAYAACASELMRRFLRLARP